MQESINKLYNHLKIHSQYSICEGAIKIDNLKDYCRDNNIKSIGLSDTSNLCGSLEFSENISLNERDYYIQEMINDTVNDFDRLAINKMKEIFINYIIF